MLPLPLDIFDNKLCPTSVEYLLSPLAISLGVLKTVLRLIVHFKLFIESFLFLLNILSNTFYVSSKILFLKIILWNKIFFTISHNVG